MDVEGPFFSILFLFPISKKCFCDYNWQHDKCRHINKLIFLMCKFITKFNVFFKNTANFFSLVGPYGFTTIITNILQSSFMCYINVYYL